MLAVTRRDIHAKVVAARLHQVKCAEIIFVGEDLWDRRYRSFPYSGRLFVPIDQKTRIALQTGPSLRVTYATS